MDSFKTAETKETLRHCLEVQKRETIPPSDWTSVPKGAFNIFLLFNLEAAWDEGHCILAIGPANGNIQTYSYYRHSAKFEAPGIMACLKSPMTFKDLEKSSGWIVHGESGNWWNEHVNCAIAIWCDETAYNKVRDYAESIKKDTGTYNLVSNNCLTFCENALAAGDIGLITRSGRSPRTIIPKDAFRDIKGVRGAYPYNSWKYWFPLGKAPHNGLRTIQDIPGEDRPLE